MAALVSAFPWRSLESIRREDVSLLATLRRAVCEVIDPPAAEGALHEMLAGSELTIHLRRVSSSPPRVEDTAVGALLAPADQADVRHAFGVMLERPLATTLAARALRRAAPRVVDGSARTSPSLAGAAAAILVAAARKRALVPLRVLSAGSAHALLSEIVSIDATPIGATFTVLLDRDAYLVHLVAPRSAIQPLPEHPLRGSSLSSLGRMPLEVPLVGAVFAMTAAELAALRPGDALFPVHRDRLDLVWPGSDVAFGVVAETDRLVLRDGPHPLGEEPMVDKEALAHSLGETPIAVCVEVGTARMTAREWSMLGAGDVISLGKRIGEHVVLRVAGVEVASGELVDVEGELGVRIVERSGATVA